MNSELIQNLIDECQSVKRTQLEFFLIANRQILDKVIMLASNGEQPHELYKQCLFVDMKKELPLLEDDLAVYLEQNDGIVDALYYTLNAMAKNSLETNHDIYSLHQMYNDVKEFTVGSASEKKPICTEPTSLSKEQILFLVKMILSEYAELLSTVCFSMMDVRETMEKIYLLPIGEYECYDEISPSLCSELLILYCVSLINNWKAMTKDYLLVLFNEVHAANMRKRDPTTLKFIIREADGKVLKPDSWYGPDLKGALISHFSTQDEKKKDFYTMLKRYIAEKPGNASTIQEVFDALNCNSGEDVIICNNEEEKSLIDETLDKLENN